MSFLSDMIWYRYLVTYSYRCQYTIPTDHRFLIEVTPSKTFKEKVCNLTEPYREQNELSLH